MKPTRMWLAAFAVAAGASVLNFWLFAVNGHWISLAAAVVAGLCAAYDIAKAVAARAALEGGGQ